MVKQRKIAGLLPRVVYRGAQPTLLCIGIGLNVSNRVPSQGTSLLAVSPQGNDPLSQWSLEVLIAIEKAIKLMMKPKYLSQEAERLLWSKKITKTNTNETWDIDGLDLEGQLIVSRGLRKEKWNRWQ